MKKLTFFGQIYKYLINTPYRTKIVDLGVVEVEFVTFRIFAVIIGQLLQFILACILASKSITRRNAISNIFAGSLCCIGLAALLNMVILFITFPLIAFGIHVIILMCYAISIYLNLLFVLYVYEHYAIQRADTYVFKLYLPLLVILLMVFICGLFIPNGIILNTNEANLPIYNTSYALYTTICIGIIGAICFMLSIKIYYKIRDYKRKWMTYTLGTLGYHIGLSGVIVVNTSTFPLLRALWYIIFIPLFIIYIILLYYAMYYFRTSHRE